MRPTRQAGADGTGSALQRVVNEESGRNPANWFTAIEGTPGVPGTLLSLPQGYRDRLGLGENL